MSKTFDGYTDAFAATPGNATVEEFSFRKLHREYRKLKKENKELKKTIKELRAAEEKRAADEKQRAAEETQKKEKSRWSKICDFTVKIIPAILSFAAVFVKGFYARKEKDEDRCKCSKCKCVYA